MELSNHVKVLFLETRSPGSACVSKEHWALVTLKYLKGQKIHSFFLLLREMFLLYNGEIFDSKPLDFPLQFIFIHNMFLVHKMCAFGLQNNWWRLNPELKYHFLARVLKWRAEHWTQKYVCISTYSTCP